MLPTIWSFALTLLFLAKEEATQKTYFRAWGILNCSDWTSFEWYVPPPTFVYNNIVDDDDDDDDV